jgi:predicted methyltransferase
MTLRPLLLAAALTVTAAAAATPGPSQAAAVASPDPALQAAVAGPQRSAENRARDTWRNPAETLAFWGVKPGVTVLELNPGAGWWTEILAPYAARTGGRYIATATPLSGPGVTPGALEGRRAFESRFSDPAVFGKVELQPFSAAARGLGPPNSVDVAFTARNVHNWLGNPTRLEEIFADLHAVLKPGGVLGVKDHRADEGAMKPGASDGYVSEAFVIAVAEKAGFVFDGRSEINANPKDTKDHPFGVWTLPPTRRSAPGGQPADPTFERAKYEAIGESDRMTLRFRKPG